MAELPVLWHLEISHYNEKACWALDYKGVRHVRRAVTPGLQEITARRLRAGRTVPILQVDGCTIGDSTRIIEEAERRWPEPALYPADPEERRRALELEDWFDEVCGPEIRRVLFADNLTEPEKFFAMFSGPDIAARRRLRVLSPIFTRIVQRRFDIQPDRVERSREVVLTAFRKVETELGAGDYLVGDSFSVADLTAASILGLIVVPPEFPYINLHPDERAEAFREFRFSLEGLSGFQWVQEMYARHRL